MAEEPLPLAGLRVIDVGTRISAPFCAGLLGEMGAEVIKVEDPRGGDFMRTIGPFVPDRRRLGPVLPLVGGRRPRAGRGPPSTSASPEGQDLFRRLVAHADVVCENFRPGTLEAWGIGPEDCDRRLSGPGSACSDRTAPTPGGPASTGWASPTGACST